MSDNDQPNIVAEPTIVQALQALVERARAGDQSSLPELQRAMDEHPELWEHFAALSGQNARRAVNPAGRAFAQSFKTIGRTVR